MNCRKYLNAKAIGCCTLVGVNTSKYPVERGNCFDLETEDGGSYRIINFAYENLKELIKRGLQWPIKIEALTEYSATIVDRRIPPEWYSNRFCEVCTPRSLLPYPQRLQQELQIERGQRIERESSTTIIGERPAEFAYADKEYNERQKALEEKMKNWRVEIKPGIVLIDKKILDAKLLPDDLNDKKSK